MLVAFRFTVPSACFFFVFLFFFYLKDFQNGQQIVVFQFVASNRQEAVDKKEMI